MSTSFNFTKVTAGSYQIDENSESIPDKENSEIQSKSSKNIQCEKIISFVNFEGIFYVPIEAQLVVIRSKLKTIIYLPILNGVKLSSTKNMTISSIIIEFICEEGIEHIIKTQTKNNKINNYLTSFTIGENNHNFRLISYGKDWIYIKK